MQNPESAVIVVLGKGVNKAGVLTPESKSSVNKAVQLFNDGFAGKIIASGKWSFLWQQPPSKSEAEAMKEYAVTLGVPVDRIIVEDRSLDTSASAHFTELIIKKIRKVKQVYLVTVDYHMRRSRYMFGKAFGERYRLIAIKSDSMLSKEELEKQNRKEDETIDLLKHIVANAKNDKDYWKVVSESHPLYAKDLNTVPEIVWSQFASRGLSRKYFESRHDTYLRWAGLKR